jgi:hypothetical protein
MVERSQPPCPEPPWLLRHGVQVRRVLGGFLLALPVVVFVTGIPRSEAVCWFFISGAGALLTSLIALNLVEQRLAARCERERTSDRERD